MKALIDLLVDRAGRAGGGLLLLLLTVVLSLSVPALSIVAAIALVIWLTIALAVRRDYVHAFRVALEKKVIAEVKDEKGTARAEELPRKPNGLVNTTVGRVIFNDILPAIVHPV